ncbi:MAG TPA: MBL fold metallo-hydrolase [Pseudonocardiaceae bacterium]|nr:MBL fold metallo-hydrolase [Pseudonocardiaceae bacterium]
MGEAEGRWVEVGEAVLARRYGELDLTVGLVLGDGGCLVVDTRGDATQGAELAAAVRAVTGDPWTVVLTHAHFDHVLGTAAFLPCPVIAHEGAARELVAGADLGRAEFVAEYRAAGRGAQAAALASARVVEPDRLVAGHTVLSVGGREVRLDHFGPGHTDNDLLVSVPDAGVVFAGDLVEHEASGPFSAESFGTETRLAAWPNALTGILGLDPAIVVCGHGDPVDREFVISARATLMRLVELRTSVRSGELDVTEALSRTSLPPDVVRAALTTED